MNKKFISVIMAAILAVSASAVCASAAEAETESSKDSSGTFFFDPGDWGTGANICFYIWDSSTNEWATKNGWVPDDTWGSAKKLGGTVKDDKIESFEFDLGGRENDKVYVIFHNKDTGGQTMDCVINDSVFGCTAHRNGNMLENPVDSKKQAEEVEFDGGSGLGSAKLITSTGKVQGRVILPGTDGAEEVAKYVLKFLNSDDPDAKVTEERVADAISGFETTADAVWEKYKAHSGEDGYNEEEAKKLIKPTEEKKDDDNSKTDGANSTSNNSSTSSNKGTSTATTTGTATTGTGTTTTADAGTAATGDTRGVVAFAGVLVAAAGTILATRKKIED